MDEDHEIGLDIPVRNLSSHYLHLRSSMPHSAIVAGECKLLHFYESSNIPMLFEL